MRRNKDWLPGDPRDRSGWKDCWWSFASGENNDRERRLKKEAGGGQPTDSITTSKQQYHHPCSFEDWSLMASVIKVAFIGAGNVNFGMLSLFKCSITSAVCWSVCRRARRTMGSCYKTWKILFWKSKVYFISHKLCGNSFVVTSKRRYRSIRFRWTPNNNIL